MLKNFIMMCAASLAWCALLLLLAVAIVYASAPTFLGITWISGQSIAALSSAATWMTVTAVAVSLVGAWKLRGSKLEETVC
jgi:hypothetical protein